MTDRSQLHSGLVWLFASLALATYGFIGLSGHDVPGVEQVIIWMSAVEGYQILLAGSVSIFIEALYFVGNFFPGSTLVVLITVLSQVQSWTMFALTMLTILIGWISASAVNIILALRFQSHPNDLYAIKDRVWTAWVPAIRANYEVSQIVAGGDPWKVFWSSVKAKIIGVFVLTIFVAIIPFIIDVRTLENKDGFISLFVIAFVMFIVGVIYLRRHTLAK